MENPQQLAARIREVMLNGTWVANTNYKDQLTNLDWQVAITTHRSLNSIATLAQHIHYYLKGISNVLKGGSLDIKDAYSFDFPPIISQVAWEAFLTKFWNHAEAFAILTEQMPEEQLSQVFVHEQYGSYQRNINGMIEHSYYHLGQIVLIKKLIQHVEER